MTHFRRALTVLVIGLGSVLLPARSSEAGIIDWMRCVVNPCRRTCSTCAAPCDTAGANCPPMVQEGSYCNPCAPSNPCVPCAVTYVRRSYMEPRTRYTTQYGLEARPTYVRRRYWDPCTTCYKTYYEATTSYVRRSYCVPVTEYVERSYLQPVTNCVTPSCPTPCPPGSATEPMESTPTTNPVSESTGRLQPVAKGLPLPPMNARPANRSTWPSIFSPSRGNVRPVGPSAQRDIPLATNARELSSY